MWVSLCDHLLEPVNDLTFRFFTKFPSQHAVDAERIKEAFARRATLHERNVGEIESRNGRRYRIWLCSIGNPDLAVYTLNLLIPDQFLVWLPPVRVGDYIVMVTIANAN